MAQHRWRGIAGTFGLVGLLLSGALACSATMESEVKKGDSLYASGDVSEAVAPYEAAIELAEEQGLDLPASSYVNLARAYKDQGETGKALAAYRRAIALDHSDASLFFEVGQLQAAQGDGRSAAASYNSALAIDPSHQEYLDALRGALEAEGLQDAYVTAVRELVAVGDGGAQMLKDLGLRYLEEGELVAGVSALEGSLELSAEQPELYLPLGKAQLSIGSYADAAVWLAKAFEGGPSDEAIASLMGQAALITGDYRASADAYAAARRANPGEPAYLAGELLAAYLEGDKGAATKQLQKATRQHPGSAALWAAWARVNLADGRPKIASEAIEKAATLAPDDRDVHLIQGQILLAQGDSSGAVAPLRLAVRAWPRYSVAQRALCQAEAGAGQGVQALESCEAALELDPSDGASQRLYADLLLSHGHLREGIAEWGSILDDSPGDAALTLRVVSMLLAVEEVEEATALARRAQGIAGAGPALQAAVALVEQANSQTEAAEAALKLALKRGGDDAGVHAVAALWFADQGRMGDARKQADRAASLDPRGSWTRLAQGAVSLEGGDQKAALSTLRALVAEHPAELMARVWLAKAYDAAGQSAEAQALRDELNAR